MGATTTTLDGIFKRNYNTGSEVFEEQQNLMAYSWKKFKVSPLKPSAQGIYNPVNMRGNERGGAINESEGFQDPGSFTPIQASVTAKLIVWPVVLTGSALELSKTNPQAFAYAADSVFEDAMGRTMSDINRQSLGKGTGQISLANGSGSASTSLTVDSALPFRNNMVIDSYASIGGAKEIDGATITAINYTTNVLTIGTSSTWSDNSIIVKRNVQNGAPTGGKELAGLQAICDTTTYSTTFEGISVSTYGEWQGNVISASSSPISQDLLQRAHNRARAIGGGKPNYLISNYGQARTFLNSELQKTRYEAADVKAGHTVLKWNDMEWLIDKDYDINEVGMYDLNNLEKFQTRDVHLADYTGSTMYQITGYDQVGAYYRYQGNLGTWKRNAHVRLTDLTEPTF